MHPAENKAAPVSAQSAESEAGAEGRSGGGGGMAAGPPSLPQPINFSDNAADDKPLSSACSMSDEIKRQVHIKRAFTKLRDDITAEPSTSSVEEAGRAAEPEEHAAGCTLWLEPEWCSRSSQSGAAGADAEDGGLFKFKQMIRGIHSSAPPDGPGPPGAVKRPLRL
jgi:hypothetical protein